MMRRKRANAMVRTVLDARGVEAHAGVEQEVAPVDRPQADAADRTVRQRVEQHAGRLDRVVGQPDRAGEHVGRAARQRRERAPGSGEAVGRLVEGAVPAEHHHHVDAGGGGTLCEPGGMTPPARLGHGHLVVGRQPLADHDPAARRHRRRRGVDQQEDLHSGGEVSRRRCAGHGPTMSSGRHSRLPRGHLRRGRFGRLRKRRAAWLAMNVVVCVKQIPDPAEPGKLEADNTLDRSGKLILDESDSYGVEMALQLVDKAGGEVTLVSMAPNAETSGLRTALAMGAAKAILVSDDALSGAGALDTAKVLAAAIKRAEPDLVLAATESSDGYTGTVPEQVAALMGLPSVTFAKEIHIEGDTVSVQRQTEAGYDEVTCPM